jgi:hypothetical protein
VLAHQAEYCLLVDIANEFASTLDEDEAEFEANGYTPAKPKGRGIPGWRTR